MDGGDFPTRNEWLEEQMVKNNIAKRVSNFSDSGLKLIQGRK